MKKAHWPVIAAMLAMGSALFGQSFTVSSPALGDEWCIGNTYVIRWRSSGVSGEVSIKLRPESGTVINIKSSMSNTGSFSWTIPATVPSGSYRVRVRTVAEDPLIYDDSEVFTIKDCSAPLTPATTVAPATYRLMPSLAVTFPGTGAKLYKGTDYTLRWRSTAVAGPIVITLRRTDAPETEPWLIIAVSTENDGDFGWLVPHSLEPGEYRIRVATISASPPLAAKSPPFSVNPAVGIGTVIPARIETLTMPVTFRTSMKSREEHWFDRDPANLTEIVVPPSEFLVGFRNRTLHRYPPASSSTICQAYRGAPIWDAARLRTLVGKTITYARLSFRHKNTDCNSLAYRVCLAKAFFYSGRMGEADPPPYQTLILPAVADGGTYHIDVKEMMSNWLREEAPDYHGEQHNYRIEFAGVDESMMLYRKHQCLSWFDNGVLEIKYTD